MMEPMAEDELDILNYRRVWLQKCPYCGGSDICSTAAPSRMMEKVYEGKKEMVRQQAECENCGRSWHDVFTLTHIEELAEGDE
jgi:ribosomal protein S27AE